MRLLKNSRSGAAVVEHVGDDVLQKLFGQLAVAIQIAERHLGLDHPELGQVARRVGVLGAEGGAEGVDVGERQREDLGFQLAADGQEGLRPKKSSASLTGLAGSSVVTRNMAPAPSASDPVMSGVCT